MAWLDWKDAYLVISLSAAAGLPLAYVLLHSHQHSSERRTSGALDLGLGFRDTGIPKLLDVGMGVEG